VLDWSLLSGPVPVVLRLVALAAGVWLLWVTLLWRRRGWLAIAELIVCLLVAALATVVLDHLARDVWMLFPDRLDLAIYLWVGVALFAVCLAVRHIASRPRLRRGAVLVTAAALEGCAVPARQGGGCQGAGNPSEHRSGHSQEWMMTAAAPKNASTVADLLGIVDGGREPHTACYRPTFHRHIRRFRP